MATVKGRLKSNGDLLITGELDETTSGNFRIDSLGDIKNVTLDETWGTTNGLVGGWPLDGNANDVTENNNHGTVYGATVVSGTNNQDAYEFDGSDDYIATTLKFDKDDFTYAAWIYIDSFQSDMMDVIDCIDSSSAEGARLGVNNNSNYFVVDNNSSKTGATGSTLSTGIGYHVAGTRSGSNMTLYLNGSVDATATHSETDTIEGREPEGIGTNSQHNTENFDGKIQDVRIYNRALSAEEIKSLYDIVPMRHKNGELLLNGTLEENATL